MAGFSLFTVKRSKCYIVVGGMILFLAHLAKGNVNFYHQLASVVWCLWESGFRGEDFLEINQSETRMACGGHVC
jgi:glucose dehydrogenase